MATTSTASGEGLAVSRHAAIARLGKWISSLRRVRRSSLTAATSRPSISRAAPASCPSHTPRMRIAASATRRFARLERRQWYGPDLSRIERQVEMADRIADIAHRYPPRLDVRRAGDPSVLVTRHLAHAEPEAERPDDHFLLDGRRVGAQSERAQDGGPNRAEPVLAVAQADTETTVDAGGD